MATSRVSGGRGKKRTAEERISHMEETLSQFEHDNPQVSEAMRIFGMSMDEYDRILAQYAPEVVTGNNTSVAGQRAED